MNARKHRVTLNLSPLDFPPIRGLGESSVFYQTETPRISNNKIVLNITKKYILLEMGDNKEHEVLAAQSIYEIPIKDIKRREDVYEFYKDATLSLNEAYQYVRTQFTTLPNLTFPNLPIENYQKEIDGVFSLLYREN